MRQAIVSLRSTTPYGQSREKDREFPKKQKETAVDHEQRTWRERCHTNEEGFIIIPPTQFKSCLSETAKFLGMQIPGKGKRQYTKHFESGILVPDPIILPIKKEDVEGKWVFGSAHGKKGDGVRVWKCFPMIREWNGDLTVYILDDTITEDVFVQHMEQAGKFVGIGYYRPARGGLWGRFKVEKVIWAENEDE